MRIINIISSALLILANLHTTSAKAISITPKGVRRRIVSDDESRSAISDMVERGIEHREAVAESTSTQISPLPITSDMNATISAACTNALSGITQVRNEAGMLACYNVLQYDTTDGTFQADLRLYQPVQPTGSFAQLADSDMMIGVVYPPSTNFRTLVKRSTRNVVSRQLMLTEIQQYSLFGGFRKTIEVSKLNTTEIMSLLIPTISVNAVDSASQKTATANLTSSDTAYFTVGQFKGEFNSEVVDPANQAAAIAASSAFVLPGTTFGIFPTGLIVTSVWMIIFVIAYGVGTLARIKHRNVYRRRKAATAGRLALRC